MEKIKKTPKGVKIKRATLAEWRKLGLPECTTTVYFGKPSWVKKLEETKKK